MANFSEIVMQLKTENQRLTRELRTINAALAVFGRTSGRKVAAHGLSAAGRKRIAAAQRARWAKVRGEKQNIVTMAKRTMSASARARIAAAQRARWAKVKAQGKAA
jgi:hypothetical protein